MFRLKCTHIALDDWIGMFVHVSVSAHVCTHICLCTCMHACISCRVADRPVYIRGSAARLAGSDRYVWSIGDPRYSHPPRIYTYIYIYKLMHMFSYHTFTTRIDV
jgi:hypothetical protein